jgi:hypothetical protein
VEGSSSGPRASNAERERFCEILERHYAEGRLSAEELSERLDRALNARNLSDLYALVADLPDLPAVEISKEPTRRGRLRWWRR